MPTSRPVTEALTVAPSATFTSPVASTWPSTVPPTRRLPSMYSWPTRRSRGPSVTALAIASPSVSFGLAALLLKASHPDVAVEARAVLDLKPLDVDVAAQAGRLAERQLVAGADRAFDLAANGHVRSLDRSLHRRARRDVDVAADVQLTLGAALHGEAAAVAQLAFEAVARAERELVARIASRLDAVFVGFVRSDFRHLSLHKSTPEFGMA